MKDHLGVTCPRCGRSMDWQIGDGYRCRPCGYHWIPPEDLCFVAHQLRVSDQMLDQSGMRDDILARADD